jgi:hypothetical protein
MHIEFRVMVATYRESYRHRYVPINHIVAGADISAFGTIMQMRTVDFARSLMNQIVIENSRVSLFLIIRTGAFV